MIAALRKGAALRLKRWCPRGVAPLASAAGTTAILLAFAVGATLPVVDSVLALTSVRADRTSWGDHHDIVGSRSTDTQLGAAVTTTSVPRTTTSSIPAPAPSTLPVTSAIGGVGELPPVWSSVGAPDVLSLSTARALFESYWELRQRALAGGSVPLLNMIEAGVARVADEDTCGCGPALPWGPVLAKSIFLTAQISFPAYFMAEAVTDIPADTGNQGWVVLVFRRLSAAQQWKVVIDSQQAIYGPETH